MRRVILIISIAGLAATGALSLPAEAGAAPSITLTSPDNGALITKGQPTFAGTADTLGSLQVTVKVYAGTSTSGSPVQTLTTTRSLTGPYSVSTQLGDGQYTDQAQQDALLGGSTGFSNTTTFTIHDAPPTITLHSPGSQPLQTSTPTFTGVAGHANGDSKTVKLTVYPGAGTTQTPVRTLSGTRDSTGRFSIQIVPALPDGRYTAVAVQGSVSGTATSRAQTFRIKAHPPALTLTQPAPGSTIKDQAPMFGGAAGDALGDSTQVTVVLYAGIKIKGKPVGTMQVTRSGATWSGIWPKPLKLGRYTAQAKQSDDAGHTATTRPVTFRIVRGPNAIGNTVTLARRGQPNVSVPITCLAPAGQTCSGNVLIVTERRYRPMAGGPIGPLRVMFVYVTLPADKTVLVTRPASPEVTRVLRRRAPLRVQVSASLTVAGGATSGYLSVRTLRLAS